MPAPSSLPETLRARQQELDKITRYADGGMVPGARFQFKGKGGPRDDQIPVKVAGQQIKVSNGENAVILPAKTAQNPQAIAQINTAIQQSNEGRPPKTGLRNAGQYADGESKDPEKLMQSIASRYGVDYVPPVDIAPAKATQVPETPSIPNTRNVIEQTANDVRGAWNAGDTSGAVGKALRGSLAGIPAMALDAGQALAKFGRPVINTVTTAATGESTPTAESVAEKLVRPAAENPTVAKTVPQTQGSSPDITR